MRILFNRRPVYGPWGGGTKVLKAVIDECTKRGHHVNFEEEITQHQDIDILFCLDPRPNTITVDDLVKYKFKHASCKLVQRIGDLGTHSKPELLNIVKETALIADLLIFPSNWAKGFLGSNYYHKNTAVIFNAPVKDFCIGKKLNERKLFTNLVTHHWSYNQMKGFDMYERLDQYCRMNPEYSFTFIGRKPDNIKLKNHILPLDIPGLIEELPKHDVYITASKEEAGANHVLEAMALGLPVLYGVHGGSIPEYCSKRGQFYTDFDDLIRLLTERPQLELESLCDTMMPLTRNSEDMAVEYVDLFEEQFK